MIEKSIFLKEEKNCTRNSVLWKLMVENEDEIVLGYRPIWAESIIHIYTNRFMRKTKKVK